jgi:hypothetical protein
MDQWFMCDLEACGSAYELNDSPKDVTEIMAAAL